MALHTDDELALPLPDDKNRRKLDWLNINLPFLKANLSGQHIVMALVILCFATPVVAALYYHHIEQQQLVGTWIGQRNEITGANTKRLIKLEELAESNKATQEALI